MRKARSNSTSTREPYHSTVHVSCRLTFNLQESQRDELSSLSRRRHFLSASFSFHVYSRNAITLKVIITFLITQVTICTWVNVCLYVFFSVSGGMHCNRIKMENEYRKSRKQIDGEKENVWCGFYVHDQSLTRPDQFSRFSFGLIVFYVRECGYAKSSSNSSRRAKKTNKYYKSIQCIPTHVYVCLYCCMRKSSPLKRNDE